MSSGPGVFISFEGPDGGGKSTQVRLLACALARLGYDCVCSFEPGGTPIGRRIREIVLDTKTCGMHGVTEFLLYAADRAQDVHEVIIPAIDEGKVVLADRFVDSSLAYQGHGLCMDIQSVRAVNEIATGGLRPDLTVLLDIDAALGVARARGRGKGRSSDSGDGDCGGDRIEIRMLEFHERVRAAYHEMAEREPARFRRIDVTEKSIEQVHQEVLAIVSRFLEKRGFGKVNSNAHS